MSSFILRALSAGTKFLFVIYLSHEYSAELLGSYALLSTVIIFSTQIFGLELNVITGRNIHKNNGDRKWYYISQQYFIHLFTYLLSLPVLYFLSLYLLNLEPVYTLLFTGIIVFDVFLGEVFRTLVSNLKVRIATLIQFLRSVPYILIVVAIPYLMDYDLTIEVIISVWFVCLILLNFLLLLYFTFNGIHKNIIKFDLKFLQFVKECIPFFIVSIMATLLSQFDKLAIGFFLGEELLGNYYLVYSLCSIMTLFVSFTVGVTNGPKAIEIFSSKGYESYTLYRYKLFKMYIKAVSFSAVIVVLSAFFYIAFSGKDIDFYYTMLFFGVASISFTLFSQVYHLDLYLLKKDKLLLKIYTISSVFSLISLVLLINVFGVVGCSISMFLSAALLFNLLKIYSRNEQREISIKLGGNYSG